MTGRRTVNQLVLAMSAVALAAASTLAQNINLDFSATLGTPTAAYGAGAGQAGTWNNMSATIVTPQALVDINGVPVTATATISAGNFDFSFNNAGTTGDDERLMDDGADLGGTGAVDTVTILHLSAGTYSVYTYAWAPDSATYVTGVNVNGAGSQNVGGPWPGAQTLAITYSRHDNIVVPADGTITVTTTTISGFATLNGIQLVGGAADQGRCCDLGGGCTITTEPNCVAPSIFGGLGTSCAGDPCRGRCCDVVGGTCEVTGVADCGAPNIFGGLGTTCNGAPCSGRCCAANSNCTLTGPSGCAGAFGGLGTNCSNQLVFGEPNPPTVTMPPAGAAPPSIITVANNFIITDVDVLVKVQHTWRNDAILQLQGPDGTIISLTGTVAAGGICNGEDNINAIFDDEGSAVNCASANLANLAAAPDHIFTNPPGGLASFDGLPSAGAWTLLATDIVTADVGTVLDWALIFDGGTPCPVVGCTCRGDVNGDTVVNGKDVKAFAQCVASGGAGCSCGDMNNSGTADSGDVTAFVTAVMNGACQ